MPRYDCNDAHLHHGEPRCLSFGGLWVDEAVASEVLRAIEGNAVEAALVAAEQMEQQRQELRQIDSHWSWSRLAMKHDWLRGATKRWTPSSDWWPPSWRLAGTQPCKKRGTWKIDSHDFDRGTNQAPAPNKELLLSLAQDLPAIWKLPSTDMRLKQRIVRILIEEIVGRCR